QARSRLSLHDALPISGIYVMAGAPLVAAAQVLVYIGAISVLVLFAIMLTQTKAAPSRLVFQTQSVGAAVAAIILALIIALTVGRSEEHTSELQSPDQL